jgi:hypothetical protein
LGFVWSCGERGGIGNDKGAIGAAC